MLVCSNQHHVMLNLSIISSWTNDPINKGSSSIQAINRTILKVPYVHNIVRIKYFGSFINFALSCFVRFVQVMKLKRTHQSQWVL